MKSLHDRLKLDKTFNPFHDSFDEKELKKAIKGVTSSDATVKKLLETAATSIIVNAHYKEVYQYLRSKIKEINLPYDQIIGSQLALRNRHYIISNQHDQVDNFKELNFEDGFKRKIDSVDKGIGRINASGALETEIDGINVFFNYLKYFKEDQKEINPDTSNLDVIEDLKWLGFISTFYYVLKSSYEDAIWQNGYISYNPISKTIQIRLKEAQSQVLFRIGYLRLENNGMGFLMAGKSLIDQKRFSGIPENESHKIPGRRIESVKVANGYLKYKLTKRSSPSYLEQLVELANESSLLAFYSYLEDVELPKLKGFTIRKLIAYYNTLIHLFVQAGKLDIKNTAVFKTKHLSRYPYRIRHDDLVNYISRRVNGTIDDCRAFIDFLTNKERVNFWDKPFVKIGDEYHFLLLPLTQPNILYQIDRWLESGGVSLDGRGPKFESHLRGVLRLSLEKKRYQYYLPARSKFECVNGKEEIDLLVVLKHIIIVAELKCIRYPLEARDIANSLSRLENGARQVKRKAEFLKTNWNEFQTELGSIGDKKMVALVICNYPLFSGQLIEEVPVIDAVLIDAYFNEGRLSRAKITNENGKETSREIVQEINYYSNEDDFSNNFEELMRRPPAIMEKLDLIEVKHNRISMEFFNFNILTEVADFKE